MLKAFLNIWRIRDLRNKLLFTFGMLAIYRIGFFIPLPGVNQIGLEDWAKQTAEGDLGNMLTVVSIFTGGSFSQSTIFGLGIMPYISAAIIFQLLGSVSERLKALKKEGPAGQQKIMEYTRYLTVVLCLVQAAMWMGFLFSSGSESGSQSLIYPDYRSSSLVWISGILGLTAGTVFLMWLGEQIDKYGIGNGISLIITAGIIAQMPAAIGMIYEGFSVSVAGTSQYSWDTVFLLVGSFIVVTAGSIIITQGQRRIPIQQAKHTRGRRVYGGQKSYLPLRVNHGGVMPIIFASSLMIFPSIFLGYMDRSMNITNMQQVYDSSWLYQGYYYVVSFLAQEFGDMTNYLYVLTYIGMIYFFAYFWTSVQFQPQEVATQLRDNGSFIPGRRPGPRTAEYLETVMERITYVGAGFLAVIAIVPTLVTYFAGVDFFVTQFLGGTGLLITVSVMLDFVQRIEANLLMRNYQGFLAHGDSGRGPKIRGTQHT